MSVAVNLSSQEKREMELTDSLARLRSRLAAAAQPAAAQSQATQRRGIPGTGWSDGHPAIGLGGRSGLRGPAVRTPASAPSAPGSGGVVGRDVKRPGKCGQTWFDLCACRYRVIGPTATTVTVNSHSSHIF